MKSLTNLKRNALASSMAVVFGLSFAGFATAQDAQTDAEKKEEAKKTEAKKIDAVQVVGSRIKRSSIEGPSPVTIITSADMEAEGHATVADALNTLTQVTGDAQNELTQNGFTPNATALNLRGLGPGRVLTLINGRRVAEYPRPYNSQSNFVNIGAIPSAAVDRIEVLSGGASAVYGSDAVSGVVNVLLKKSFEGQEINLLYGEPTRGGAGTTDISYLGGASADNWNLVWALQYFERGEIFASERDFMDSYRDEPNNPNPTSVEGLRLRLGFAPTIAGFQQRYGVDDNVCTQFSEFETYDASVVNNGGGPSAGLSCAFWGYPATQAIRNSDNNKSAYIFGSYTFDNGNELYGSVSFNNAVAKADSNTQFISQSGMFSGLADYTTNIVEDNIGDFINFQRIFTPSETGGLGGTKYTEDTYDITVGLRGTFSNDFDWDLGFSSSHYQSDTQSSRLLREETINFFGEYFGNLDFGVTVPYYALDYSRFLRPLTPAEFASISTDVFTKAESESNQASFVVTGDLFEMKAGNVGFATVVEFASQSYSLTPDPRTLPGNNEIINLSDTQGGGDRSRYAVGGEISVPWTETLKSNFAARYDHYNDDSAIAGAFTWNTGIEWRPTDTFLARATYGTTFRAPDMHYIYAGESGFFTTVTDEYSCRNDGEAWQDCASNVDYSTQVSGTRKGDITLKEEQGKSWTAGFVWDIFDNVNFSLDYYNIALTGGISDDSTNLLNVEAGCRLGTDRQGNAVDPGSAKCLDALARVHRAIGPMGDLELISIDVRPRNIAAEKTTGVDASLRIKQETERMGRFTYSLAWSHVLSLEYQEFAGAESLDYRDNPQNFDYRSRVRGSVGWQKNDWNVTLFMNRLGSLPNWAETGRIKPMFYFNTTIGYQISEDFSVGLRVNNILDKIAPKDDTYDSYPFFWRGYSPIGREVWLELNYSFGKK